MRNLQLSELNALLIIPLYKKYQKRLLSEKMLNSQRRPNMITILIRSLLI